MNLETNQDFTLMGSLTSDLYDTVDAGSVPDIFGLQIMVALDYYQSVWGLKQTMDDDLASAQATLDAYDA
jgi:hypothetical protein